MDEVVELSTPIKVNGVMRTSVTVRSSGAGRSIDDAFDVPFDAISKMTEKDALAVEAAHARMLEEAVREGKARWLGDLPATRINVSAAPCQLAAARPPLEQRFAPDGVYTRHDGGEWTFTPRRG